MRLITSALTVTGSPQYINLNVGSGVRLRQASAQNVTRGSRLCHLYLCSHAVNYTGQVIPLDNQAELMPLKSAMQAGYTTSVIWSGDILLTELNVLVAIFENPTVGDNVLVTVGYD